MSHIVSYQCKYVRSLKTQQIAQEDPSLLHYQVVYILSPHIHCTHLNLYKKNFQHKKLISILYFFFLLLLFNKLIMAAWLQLERQRKLVIFYSQNRGKE